ncbi:MAG: FCD domain-containing protein [Anaerolineaceae bacterium]
MNKQSLQDRYLSDFTRYLVEQKSSPDERIPALTELSKQLNISVTSLREQMEAARELGLVEARPRTGIRRKAYNFLPAVRQSVAYSIAVNPDSFEAFSDLRIHIEESYWYEAAELLTADDHAYLQSLIDRAESKLSGRPPQIPHDEHRALHLSIYRKLNNPFVMGLLEAYWEMYEAVGLDVYNQLEYLKKVWQYHKRIVAALKAGNYQSGYKLLREHKLLLEQRA